MELSGLSKGIALPQYDKSVGSGCDSGGVSWVWWVFGGMCGMLEMVDAEANESAPSSSSAIRMG